MENPTSTATSAGFTLRVEGMDCGGCERKVVAALGRLEGIEEVSASSVTGSVTIHPEPHRAPSHQSIERILNELGYRLAAPSEKDGSDTPPAPWWQTAKGRLVLVTGGLLALALVLRMTWPDLGGWPFVAATLVGLVPIAQGAWGALKMRNPFTLSLIHI